MTNAERVSKALDLLSDGLKPRCEQTWRGFYGEAWLARVRRQLRGPARAGTTADIAFLLGAMKVTWNEIFGHGFSGRVRSLVFEVAEVRNSWAHKEGFSDNDTARALDSMERLLEAFGGREQQRQVHDMRREVMGRMFGEGPDSERHSSFSQHAEGRSTAGQAAGRATAASECNAVSGCPSRAGVASDVDQPSRLAADGEHRVPRWEHPTRVPAGATPVVLIRLGQWQVQRDELEPGVYREGHGYRAGMSSQELLDSIRAWWRISPDRVGREGIRYAVAVHQGLTLAVVQIGSWRRRQDGRWAFSATLVTEGRVFDEWVGPQGRLAEFTRGAQNPIQYSR